MNFGIIAAGEGSRLVQEGVRLPKPLVDIDGRPMIRRLIDIFMSCGAEYIAVIVNNEMKEVASYLWGLQAELDVRLDVTVKSTPSSMHSFFELGKLLRNRGRFVLTTVDTIFREKDFRRYVETFVAAPDNIEGLMAVTSHIDDEKPLYVATSGDMRITGFLDSPEPGIKYVSGGIYGLDSRAIEVLDNCLESGVQRMRNYQRSLVAEGLDLRAFDMGKIIDVDHAGDIAKAREFIG